MTDPDDIRRHYGNESLIERLKAALPPGDQSLSPAQLAPLDQFHTLGAKATSDLAELAGVTKPARVLDIGSGLGGPARLIAATYGCRVTGVDLSAPFVEAARYLTERTGQGETVTFATASALDLPFSAGAFDIALLQHVAMNINDRARLYGEIHRVLAAGGRFATFDIVSVSGEPIYPLPWARTADLSALMTAQATCAAVEAAGFTTLSRRDDTPAAIAWFAKLHDVGPPPAPNLVTIMGADFPVLTGNLAGNLTAGRLAVLSAVFEKIA